MILASKVGNLNISVYNVREVTFDSKNNLKYIYEKEKIKGVILEGVKVKLGESIKVFNLKISVNYIDKISDRKCCISSNKANITTIFVLPMVFSPQFLFLINPYRLNSFLFKDGLYDKKLYILLKKEDRAISLETIINNYLKNTDYKLETLNDNKHLFLTISLPSNFLTDIHYIINSRYSYVSQLAKDKLINYYKQISPNPEEIEKSRIFKILNRDNNYRKSLEQQLGVIIPSYLDLYEGFNIEKENFNYSSFVKEIENEQNSKVSEASSKLCHTFI